MHAEALNINVDEVIDAGPLKLSEKLTLAMWAFVAIGVLAFIISLFTFPPSHVWGVFHVNLFFWTGLAVGGVAITAILQIVRAQWAMPVRRLAEANVAFLPWAFLFFLMTWFGKEHIFPWAVGPMPGREWWMQPNFVYLRFIVLLAILFFVMFAFIRLSLRGDVGMVQAKDKSGWSGWWHNYLGAGWGNTEAEVLNLQRRMSVLAPVVIILYVLIYSLYTFEMLMSMDTIWYANMFGGFIFVGNIYLAWAVLSITTVLFIYTRPQFAKVVTTQQLWDLGKLTFGFSMLWGYLFFSHFMVQWYGNLPEETQWLILRTREYPWKGLAYLTFSMCFVIPWVMLLGRDMKKTPWAFATVCCIPFFGVWLEKYMLIMPQLSPEMIPFGILEVCFFLGFLGVYVLSVAGFLKRFPFVPVSHPLTRGSNEW